MLTDTFQSYEDGDRDDLDIFPGNNARIERQRQIPITVVLGNPPYSAKQASANDNNANLRYPTIDNAIRDSYAEKSVATNKSALYDSYIRAIKWASLRIRNRGVIAFVTNGGWLDANTADGMRKSLTDEFTSVHVLNLRGNQRTAGEQSRREGGKIFGSGSRATVAVTILVKNPDRPGPATVHYADIGDYLTREEKLTRVSEAGGIAGLEPVVLLPNDYGDWLNQRRADFDSFVPIGDKQKDAVFATYSRGLATARDAWCYGPTANAVAKNMRQLLDVYENDRIRRIRTEDSSKISWNRSLIADYERARKHDFRDQAIVTACYRPFVGQKVYFDRNLNDMVYRLPRLFPTPRHHNVGFYAPGLGASKPFSVLAVSSIPDVNLWGSEGGQFFPRWTWEPTDDETLDLSDGGDVIAGYRQVDNVTDDAVIRWRSAYGADWSKDDIFFYCYGLLHSPEYRERYAVDLKKSLPRIPLVADSADARAFAEAGRRLSDLHVGYESVDPFPLEGLDSVPADPGDDAAHRFYAVADKKMRFGKPTTEQKAAGERHDRSVILYNDRITLRGIPESAYRYQLGARSAVEWIIDRYYVKTDKASGIVNDPNDWSREVGDPRYILDLLARVVTVSVETMRIVDALPVLTIRDQQ